LGFEPSKFTSWAGQLCGSDPTILKSDGGLKSAESGSPSAGLKTKQVGFWNLSAPEARFAPTTQALLDAPRNAEIVN
jgi:hypothetical protein